MVVKGIHFYKNGTIRVLGLSPESFRPNDFNARGEIKELSKKSLQRMALIMNETTVEFKTIITLTYPKEYSSNGRFIKNNLSSYLKYLVKVFPFCAYFWVLEFQSRGAPHFHILIDRIVDNRERFLLAYEWSEIVGIDNDKVFYRHSQQSHCDKIRDKNGAKKYIMMYALKPKQKKVPIGYYGVGRFWGCNKKVLESVPKPDYVRMSEEELREFLYGSGEYSCNFNNFPMVLFRREIVSRETIVQNTEKSLTSG